MARIEFSRAKFIHEYFIRSIPNLETGTYNKIFEEYFGCDSLQYILKDATAQFDSVGNICLQRLLSKMEFDIFRIDLNQWVRN